MCWNRQAVTQSRQVKQSSQQKPQAELTSPKSRGKVYEVKEQQKTSSEGSTDEAKNLRIDPVSVEGVKKASTWFVNLGIQGGKLNIKLDTGVEVSVLPLQLYNKLQIKPPLKSTSIRLAAYRGTSITPAGTCKLTCSSPVQNKRDVKFYVASVQA